MHVAKTDRIASRRLEISAGTVSILGWGFRRTGYIKVQGVRTCACGVVARTLGFRSLGFEVRIRVCAGLSCLVFQSHRETAAAGSAPAMKSGA